MTTPGNRLSDADARRRLNFIGFTDSDANLMSSLKGWAQALDILVKELKKAVDAFKRNE